VTHSFPLAATTYRSAQNALDIIRVKNTNKQVNTFKKPDKTAIKMRLSGWEIVLLLLPFGLVSAVRQLEENQSIKSDHLHSGERQVRRRNNKSNASADHQRHSPSSESKKNGRSQSVSLDSDDYDWLDADTSEAIDSSEFTAVESVKSSGETHGKLIRQLNPTTLYWHFKSSRLSVENRQTHG